jgi:hypothetical protein
MNPAIAFNLEVASKKLMSLADRCLVLEKRFKVESPKASYAFLLAYKAYKEASKVCLYGDYYTDVTIADGLRHVRDAHGFVEDTTPGELYHDYEVMLEIANIRRETAHARDGMTAILKFLKS